jgi:hypothetical protein
MLDDDHLYDYPLLPKCGPPSELIGHLETPQHARRAHDGRVRFVKAKLGTGEYLMCHVDGFKVEYSLLTESETLAALGQGSFVTSVTRRHAWLKARRRLRPWLPAGAQDDASLASRCALRGR